MTSEPLNPYEAPQAIDPPVEELPVAEAINDPLEENGYTVAELESYSIILLQLAKVRLWGIKLLAFEYGILLSLIIGYFIYGFSVYSISPFNGGYTPSRFVCYSICGSIAMIICWLYYRRWSAFWKPFYLASDTKMRLFWFSIYVLSFVSYQVLLLLIIQYAESQVTDPNLQHYVSLSYWFLFYNFSMLAAIYVFIDKLANWLIVVATKLCHIRIVNQLTMIIYISLGLVFISIWLLVNKGVSLKWFHYLSIQLMVHALLSFWLTHLMYRLSTTMRERIRQHPDRQHLHLSI